MMSLKMKTRARIELRNGAREIELDQAEIESAIISYVKKYYPSELDIPISSIMYLDETNNALFCIVKCIKR